MKFYILLLLFITFILETQAIWNLTWHDEFDGNTLDLNKWNAIANCDGNGYGQLECSTNSSKNLRLIDGTLAITALIEKQSNLDYTSGKIITKNSFTFGRFEIRAALPKGKLLRPTIYLNPASGQMGKWPINGEIDIMTNSQTQKLGHGLHYNRPPKSVYRSYMAEPILNYFHTYAIEWTKTEIKWFFNEIEFYNISINQILGNSYNRSGQPFDRPFKLIIHLGVGGLDFANQNITITTEEAYDWNCSLFIIDFVRIYEWIDEDIQQLDISANKHSSYSICRKVMPTINMRPKMSTNVALMPILTTISLILLLALIPLVIYLFLRQKKLKEINLKQISELNYEDVKEIDVYDEFIHPENLYQDTGVGYAQYYENLNISPEVDPNGTDPTYVVMTSKDV